MRYINFHFTYLLTYLLTNVISFSRPSVFLLVFSMSNRKCTAWLSSLTVLCYLCICTCILKANNNTNANEK